MDDKTRLQYYTACLSWLLGSILLLLCAWTFLRPFDIDLVATIIHTAYLRDQSNLAAVSGFPGWLSVSAHLIASMTAAICLFSLAKTVIKAKAVTPYTPPLYKFFLTTQPPLRKLGIATCILIVLVFCAKSGMDMRHAYVLGIAAIGIGVVFAIAMLPYVFVKPMKEHAIATAGRGTSKPRFNLSNCLMQSAGAALVLFSITTIVSIGTYVPFLAGLLRH